MQLKDAKILVIDDDADVLTAIRLLLKSRVAEIHVERKPGNIPSLLAEKKFDVVILDMNYNGLVQHRE